MDNDTIAIKEASLALIELQVKYKEAPILEKLALKPMLDEAINDFAELQRKLLKEGTIVSDADLQEIEKIKTEIAAAADQQQTVAAGARFLSFVAKFV